MLKLLQMCLNPQIDPILCQETQEREIKIESIKNLRERELRWMMSIETTQKGFLPF